MPLKPLTVEPVLTARWPCEESNIVAEAPIDAIGTGSYLPSLWNETYATADIIEYHGEKRAKMGRKFLFRA